MNRLAVNLGMSVGPVAGGFLAEHSYALLFVLAACIPVALVFFQLMAALPLYLKQDLHMGESTLGIVFGVNTVLIVLTEVPLNAAMARWSHRASLSLGAALMAIGFGALAIVTAPISAAGTVVIWTVGEMVLFPSLSAYISDLAPANQRGSYMGLYAMTFSLAFTRGTVDRHAAPGPDGRAEALGPRARRRAALGRYVLARTVIKAAHGKDRPVLPPQRLSLLRAHPCGARQEEGPDR